MAHDFYARWTHQSDDVNTYPNIAIHQFSSVLREYARNKITREQIRDLYNIGVDDYFDATFDVIDSEVDEVSRLRKVYELDDTHMINESSETNSLYPDIESLKSRNNIG